MTTYDKLMLEVKVIEGGSGYLEHYIFDLDGFTEAYDALLAKGCKPIPPLTAVDDFALHTALLHESYSGYGFGLLLVCQFLFSIRSDWGLPCWIIRLRMAQPIRLSTC